MMQHFDVVWSISGLFAALQHQSGQRRLLGTDCAGPHPRQRSCRQLHLSVGGGIAVWESVPELGHAAWQILARRSLRRLRKVRLGAMLMVCAYHVAQIMG